MFYLYLKWKFLYSTIDFLRAWRSFLSFGLNIFSVPILLKTFLSPWHRYQTAYPTKFDIVGVFSAFFSNIMSRVIGMILRTFFIFIGLIFELFIFIVGVCLFLIWLLLPLIVVYFLYTGILFLI